VYKEQSQWTNCFERHNALSFTPLSECAASEGNLQHHSKARDEHVVEDTEAGGGSLET